MMNTILKKKKMDSRLTVGKAPRFWLTVLIVMGCLVGCGGGSGAVSHSSNDPAATDDGIVEPDVAVLGAPVKGLLQGATVEVWTLDYSSPTLKGELLATGTTDNGQYFDLAVPANRLGEGPYLIESQGGFEASGRVADITTLRTVISNEQLRTGVKIYATPLTTFALELARTKADLTEPATAAENFANSLQEQNNTVVDYFDLGDLGSLAGDDHNLFNTSPLLGPNSEVDNDRLALAYRTSIEVMVALVNVLASNADNADSNVIFNGLIKDLSDGQPDGRQGEQLIEELSGLSAAQIVETLTPSAEQWMQLTVPGSDAVIADLNQILVDELVFERRVTPQLAFSDSIAGLVPGDDQDGDGNLDSELLDHDGDGVLGSRDLFPYDANKHHICHNDEPLFTEAGCREDDDNDTFPNPIDAFPLDPTEWADENNNGRGDNADAANQAPVVAISTGGNITTSRKVDLALSAIASDPEGDTLQFSWHCVQGPLDCQSISEFSQSESITLNFDIAGAYKYRLDVYDGDKLSSATVNVTVTPDGEHVDGFTRLGLHFYATTLAPFVPDPSGVQLNGDLVSELTVRVNASGHLVSGGFYQELWDLTISLFMATVAAVDVRTDSFIVPGANLAPVIDTVELGGRALRYTLGSYTLASNDASTLISGGASSCMGGATICSGIPVSTGYDGIQIWLKPKADGSGVEQGKMEVTEERGTSSLIYFYTMTPL